MFNRGSRSSNKRESILSLADSHSRTDERDKMRESIDSQTSTFSLPPEAQTDNRDPPLKKKSTFFKKIKLQSQMAAAKLLKINSKTPSTNQSVSSYPDSLIHDSEDCIDKDETLDKPSSLEADKQNFNTLNSVTSFEEIYESIAEIANIKAYIKENREELNDLDMRFTEFIHHVQKKIESFNLFLVDGQQDSEDMKAAINRKLDVMQTQINTTIAKMNSIESEIKGLKQSMQNIYSGEPRRVDNLVEILPNWVYQIITITSVLILTLQQKIGNRNLIIIICVLLVGMYLKSYFTRS